MIELKKHMPILLTMTLINAFVLWNFIAADQFIHGIGYFVFFYVALFVIHYFTTKFPPKKEADLKKPKNELILITVFTVLGCVFLVLNFYLKATYDQIGFLIRLPVLLGVLFFTFPVGIALYLLVKKYTLVQLGLRIKPFFYLFLGCAIWGLTGLFAFVFNKSGIIWAAGYKELGGVIGLFLNGLLAAGLVEEFSRFAIQSRFEKILKPIGFNILIATIIWSFMHFPINYFKGDAVKDTFVYCIQIIPLGFIWGYLTQRTKSILPSTLAHGLNLWGFQNG